MAIFNTSMVTPVEESFVEAEYVPGIDGSVECGYQIAAEAYSDMTKIISGLYVADIMIESAIYEGSDPEPLIEGAVRDAWDKFIAFLKRTWAKIKAWFKEMFERMKAMMTNSKNFVLRYQKIIDAKSADGFEYNLYKIDDDIAASYEKYANLIDSNVGAAYDGDSFTSHLINKLNSDANSLSQLKKIITDDHIGEREGAYSKVDKSMINHMVDFCKNQTKLINDLKRIENKTNKFMQGAIKNAENRKKEAEARKDEAAASGATKTISQYKSGVSLLQNLNTLYVNISGKIVKKYVAVLRAFVLYKPAKVQESYVDEDLMKDGQSLFETAMSMI